MAYDDSEGVAALTLVESLLVTLEDAGLLSPAEVDDVYETAIAAHRMEGDEAADPAAARILERLHAHGNSVRRKPR